VSIFTANEKKVASHPSSKEGEFFAHTHARGEKHTLRLAGELVNKIEGNSFLEVLSFLPAYTQLSLALFWLAS